MLFRCGKLHAKRIRPEVGLESMACSLDKGAGLTLINMEEYMKCFARRHINP
jgi:hypothetical protein